MNIKGRHKKYIVKFCKFNSIFAILLFSSEMKFSHLIYKWSYFLYKGKMMRVISKEELLCVSGGGGRDDLDKLQQTQDQKEETWGDSIANAIGEFFSGVGTAMSDCSSGATSGAAMFGGYGAAVGGPPGAAAGAVVGAAGGCVVNTGVGVISAIGKAAGK